MRSPAQVYPWLACGLIVCANQISADDWPAFRRDAARTATSSETLAFPLERAWTHQSAQPPAPAWPPPHFILLNRLDFDYAPQPVAAEGIVCFGSSSDDTVRALDLATGKLRWRFTTGGPVRVAPQIAEGRVFFASDDGWAYCVDAKSGELVWSFNAAPNSEQNLGNGRMISRWPIRTGVLVDQGAAYLAAGIWATEGVFVYALDSATGREIWCNETADYAGVDFNPLLTVENRGELRHGVHDGDFGFYGLTPQGALAVTDETLLIPNGYNTTAGLDRETGRLLFAEPRAGLGGTWLRAEKDSFYSFYRHRNMRVLLMNCDARTGERISLQQHGIANLITTPPAETQKELLSHEPGQTSMLVRDGKPLSRNAYAMALAGETLILGQDGYVSAVAPESDSELWRAPVDGKAYGLAIADGRLIVTTDRGEVTCFGGPVGEPDTPKNFTAAPALDPATLAALRAAGMDRGYALVVGDESGELSLGLAANTHLRVVNTLSDSESVQRLRTKLIDSTDLYGSRIHVPNAAEGLPFADHFANAVIVSAGTKLSGAELFRVLRPCGGVLMFTSGGKGEFVRVAGEIDQQLLAGETTEGDFQIVRGRLPGALDWDSTDGLDRLAAWPLRPLWYGGPSSAQVTNHKNENLRPLAAYGRYFVLGEDSLTAVDAYNAAILWTRPIPGRSPDLRESGGVLHYTDNVWSRELRDAHRRSIRVNDRHVYLQLNEGHFGGKSSGSFVLDAATGEQTQIFAPYVEPENFLLEAPRTWPVKIDESHSGTLTLIPGDGEIEVRLTTVNPAETSLDEWDLFFDFRSPDERFGLFNDEVVRLRAKPNSTVKIPAKATSFGFAAILNSHDGGEAERIARGYLFCDFAADGVNNGWANVRLSASEPVPVKPAIIAGELADLPRVQVVAGWPKAIDPAIAAQTRIHPLTGEPGPRIFRSGTGTCGGFDFSATSVIKRSGAAKVLGIYDFAEDSGLHTFVGVSAGCGPTTLTSQGMVIVSESKARCVCTFPFRTTLAMAPAQRRLNEDWAIFFDRDVDTQVRQAPINLGAPGDRRDADGKLWLGFPRLVTQEQALGYPKQPGANTEAVLPGVWPIARQAGILVPLEIECSETGGPYRFNGDRNPVSADPRPWLYASGYRGIREATLKLNFLKPLATTALKTAPKLDGSMPPGEWPDQPQAHLTETKTDIFLAHDDSHIFIAARRAAPPLDGKSQRRGELVWTAKTEGEDAEIWNDDSCEIFLTDTESNGILRLGISLSGARFEALNADASWNGAWTQAAAAADGELIFEMAIPLQTLKDAGLTPQQLLVNLQINRDAKTGEALTYLGAGGRDGCTNFTPLGIGTAPPIPPRKFRVRLHFAEPDDIGAGERIFSVFINDRPALRDFDVVAEAGGRRKSIVREFPNIEASEALMLRFEANSLEPILSALEVFEENGEF